ncbi:hypothetical protein [Planctomicrobium sp. SH527]|uniref:hypothetical protein n=1 Tax=Planctomicrobium sp. SH527 TaxID=3448123 RepID=UPI003F5B19D5
MPLSFHQRLRDRGIVAPFPPVKVSRDSNGKPMRDGQGQVLTISDTRNSEYLKEVDRYHRVVAVLSVVEALQADPDVSFETSIPVDPAGIEEWWQYADGVFLEMEQAGFAAGDLILLCREICRLSNLVDDHLMVAQSSFSQSREHVSG